ncbi:MAG: YlxR family protein [Christensenella sp.]
MNSLDKKQPIRMCAACRHRKPKQELIRIIKTPDSGFILDEGGKAQGRGVYLCADKACIEKAKKIFPKVMHCTPDDNVYEALLRIAENNGK